MAKMCLKKQSKRVPARRRYKIEKRVRQHNKKKRREEKKNPKAKKANKMIIVPSVCPFKEEILKEAEEFKAREKEERKKAFERNLLKKKEQEEQEDASMEEEEPASLDDLIKSAQSRQKQHEIWEEDQSVNVDTELTNRTENSLKAYYKEFRKVVEAADVVLEVVDARDPLGTRCLQVEEAVKEAKGNKKLVLVLNKADLVPKDVLIKWLQYLRRTIPAIAFKASTQKQKQNLSRRKVKKNWSEKETNVSPCVGAEVLMSLLNNYCRNKDIKTSIHVGIVGLPNVGKSSIINSLKRSRACNVGSMPGITKSAQVVELDKKIKLLDSPGIVFAKTTNETDASTVLKNAVHVQTIADPITPATAILQRASKTQMMTLYNLPEYDTPQEFFISLAETTGKFKKGGIPDTTKAARQLLEDWNRGKIRYFTQPPEVKDESHVSAAIVTETGDEFDLDSFKAIEAETLEKMDSITNSVKVEPVILDPSQPVVAAAALEEKMEDDTAEASHELINENVTVVATKKRKIDRGESKKSSGKEIKKEKTVMDLEGNQKLNLHKKLSFKKLKKMQARNSRQASSLAGVLENFNLGSDDTYDFDTDFTS
ncbi:Guanine nucleotide-binding protein-like 3-like protein [Frankliniella fusca]|uniref:Guanine nucleotide-binding protein-like 3 homolog n=1 Tax=Frankliniella fusca TaxID=407009 RepID=A0AAE1HV35_9NEOP|nr:Guanine nucleotide-binding protein-like 3-like protein [Frankliniella fusca]